MNLVELEIRRYNWAEILCGCGRRASHLEADFLRLIRPDRARRDTDILDGHVLLPSVLYPPAVPLVSIALAVLSTEAPNLVREEFAKLLLFLLSGEGQAIELEGTGRDLIAECSIVAREGLWTLYSELAAGRSVVAASYAYEALTLIEEDVDRLALAQVAYKENLRTDLQPA